ncbi:MAG TPA: HK97 family phage prohead protease [Dysgonamonadaceae bacterium]|nr:HK97 family phage prohead protease [Dysgonamonadaceae bacterium]
MISKDREYRSFGFEPVEDEAMIIEGVPIVFEQRTLMYEHDGLKFYEQIDKEALRNALVDDVVLNIDHVGKPAAKTKNGTLELEVRDGDVFMKADLSKNATGRELYEDIKNGFYDKMSFAFTVTDQEYDSETRTRTIKKIDRLYDVSAVTVPAYSQTTLMARSFFTAEAEKEVAEAMELEKEKLKLEIRTKTEGVN